ncbi:calcium/calmodulin-dependent protein kinase type II subunit alpha-like [Histomonas meleagridis]|uniref:calcium/calmodulin-dependent protein kinase type II subunit alpha-like n=1 Tax=Histomonas meleagridis TaxID=135588 RepID=UPI003559F81A|nr:calcium/calmodulin-dependent protein kinase type II subunit alpha-like [Histomonas meleagridis]KAH0798078.1 calcium/calmodulin-dependent protein kinase type II subunit alpha-like [Histomonas meleagridis]
MMEDPAFKDYCDTNGFLLTPRSLKFYKVIGNINGNSYSIVYKGVFLNSQVAVKFIRNDKEYVPYINNEIFTLKKLKEIDNNYIIEFLAEIKSIDGTYVGIITDLQDGDLLENVGINQYFDEKMGCQIMYQLLHAIDALHQQGIVHRNINLNNVLLSNSGNFNFIRLTGFSIAADATQSNSIRQQLGVPLYWAPEIVRNETYSYSVDIWAAGVIMYYILTGFVPFNPFDQSVMFQQIVNGIKIDSFPSNPPISNEAKDLILKMLDTNPFNRVTAREALNHPWIKNNYVSYDYDLKSDQARQHKNDNFGFWFPEFPYIDE